MLFTVEPGVSVFNDTFLLLLFILLQADRELGQQLGLAAVVCKA